MKILGYLTAIGAVMMIITGDIMNGIFFAFHAILAFRYNNRKFHNRELMIAMSIFWIVINLFAVLEGSPGTLIDVAFWVYSAITWYKN